MIEKTRFYGKIDPKLNVPEDHRIWPRLDDMDYTDRRCAELGGIDTVWAGGNRLLHFTIVAFLAGLITRLGLV